MCEKVNTTPKSFTISAWYVVAIALVALVIAIPISSSWFYDRSEKTDLYIQLSAVGQENARLHQEVIMLKKQNQVLNSYIDLLHQNGLIPDGFPQLPPMLEPTPTPGQIPVLIPTLPPVELEIIEATPTPFMG